MGRPSTRDFTPADQVKLDEVFAALRAHFHQWTNAYESEHDLIAFAYYEGCGGSRCCGAILAEAAPLALGKQLVQEHGFKWTMARSQEDWHFAVYHPEAGMFIDLQSLEGGSWAQDDPYYPPSPGQRTHTSYENIVKQMLNSKTSPDSKH